MTDRLDAYADMAQHRDEGRLVHLDVDVCLHLLATRHVGRLAVSDEDGPVVFPVNYTVDRDTVVFRTGMGSKLAATDQFAAVAFQVDDVDVERRTGWSVLVRGRLAEVTDGAEVDRLEALPLDAFAGGDRDHFVRVMPWSVSGRRIAVPDRVPTDWLTPSYVPDWTTADDGAEAADDATADWV